MRFFILIFIFILSINSRSLYADSRVAGTVENVDLIISNLENEDNHDYGEMYQVINHNNYSMRISIKMTEGTNAVDRLIRNTIIVDPQDKADLGTIVQKDATKHADWKIEWQSKIDK